MVASFPAPYTPTGQLLPALRGEGYAVLPREAVASLPGVGEGGLAALTAGWDDLPLDTYLRDGGSYRRRRHSCFVVEGGRAVQAPHRAHWQSLDYNALHGGMQRWFQPIEPAVSGAIAWRQLLSGLARWCSTLRGERTWFVEAHQFRIDTTDGIGRPTPEGAHRDGVDFVAVLLLDREGIKGGETRVFAAAGPDGQRFTLEAPWSLLFLDDERVIHESTPIQPLDAQGHRDTLVLTFRKDGFQGDPMVG